MTAETTMRKRRTYQNMQEIINLAKKYSPKLVRGYSAGNISVVDKKSWLEVCDRKHRYGANLRAYYKEWKRQPCQSSFWEWLDDESVEVEGVPRTKLESETVLYCDTKEERQKFALSIRNGRVYQDASQEIVQTGDDGWIFVLRDGVLYGGQKETKKIPRIHHTSFVAGECVQTAGMMVIRQGIIETIYPHSGHYRPSEHELLVLLRFLVAQGIDLVNIRVDVQRIQKVFRDCVNGALVRKVDNAHFWSAYRVLDYLEQKHYAWEIGLFTELINTVVHCFVKSEDPIHECVISFSNSSDCEMAEEPPVLMDQDGVCTFDVSRETVPCDPIYEDPSELMAVCHMQQ